MIGGAGCWSVDIKNNTLTSSKSKNANTNTGNINQKPVDSASKGSAVESSQQSDAYHLLSDNPNENAPMLLLHTLGIERVKQEKKSTEAPLSSEQIVVTVDGKPKATSSDPKLTKKKN